MTPSHWVMGVSAAQFSEAVPAQGVPRCQQRIAVGNEPRIVNGIGNSASGDAGGGVALSSGRIDQYEHGGYQKERSDGECREQMEAVGQCNDG